MLRGSCAICRQVVSKNTDCVMDHPPCCYTLIM